MFALTSIKVSECTAYWPYFKFDFLEKTKTKTKKKISTFLQRCKLSSGKLDKLWILFTSVRYERNTDTNAATDAGRVSRWYLSLQFESNASV